MTLKKTAYSWRLEVLGSVSSLGIFLSALFISQNVFAELKMDATPYVPNQREYRIEMGTLWEEQTFFWLAGQVGFHIGKCPKLSQDRCQLYLDFLGGLGLRNEDFTNWVQLGVRMQFINYPSPWSHSIELNAGATHSRVNAVYRNEPAFGVGFGLTRYLHKNLDLSIRSQLGHNHQLYAQFGIGLELKVDHWVEGFATAIEKGLTELGQKTGNVLKSPFQKKDEKSEK